MINKIFNFEIEDENTSDKKVPTINEIISNIDKQSSKKICQMIVSARYFNFKNDLEIKCMEELSNRRLSGDEFDFESYIDNAAASLPELNFSQNFDIRDLLNNAIKKI